jgi:hypothetical protein
VWSTRLCSSYRRISAVSFSHSGGAPEDGGTMRELLEGWIVEIFPILGMGALWRSCWGRPYNCSPSFYRPTSSRGQASRGLPWWSASALRIMRIEIELNQTTQYEIIAVSRSRLKNQCGSSTSWPAQCRATSSLLSPHPICLTWTRPRPLVHKSMARVTTISSFVSDPAPFTHRLLF